MPKLVVSEALRVDEGVCACIFDSISIFSSFPSNRSFSSRTSHSRILTRSSSDSVYPLGKALLLSLSDVLHSNPTVEHWEQVGVSPSHRIFLLRQRSQACAIRDCVLVPTFMTFIGRIPGIAKRLRCGSSQARSVVQCKPSYVRRRGTAIVSGVDCLEMASPFNINVVDDGTAQGGGCKRDDLSNRGLRGSDCFCRGSEKQKHVIIGR